MKKVLPIFLLFFLFINGYQAAHLSPSLQVNARCSGASEVPAVNTDGYALGILTISKDRLSSLLDFQASGLSGPITGIHIHEARAGDNGPVVVNLTPFLDDNSLSTEIRFSSDFSLSDLISGAYYLNVHTAQNPDGEVRGQFALETDQLYGGVLSGDNEVPAISTDARGYVSAVLSSSGAEITLSAEFEGLSSPIIGAHLHEGSLGLNGPVVLDLSSFVSLESSISASLDPSGILESLRAGEIYINIHTVLNPDGELRAQLLPSTGLSFDCPMSGDNEVPSVSTDAAGLINFSYAPESASLSFEGYISTTSSTIVGAHLHMAAAGSNGPVVVDLSSQIDNGIVSGSTANISTRLLDALLSGQIYLNVHTEDNPSGEIRGQVIRVLREAYMCEVNGAQQVPPVNSQARGVAMVSIDRTQSNGHFMLVTDGLSDEFQAAHFHDGGPGVNGGVLFDVTPFYIDGRAAFGYWMDMGEAAVKFRTSGIYLNTHTTTYPNGEIRGDFIRSSNSYSQTTNRGRAQIFASSNTLGNIGLVTIGYDGSTEFQSFPAAAMDADGISYNQMDDYLYQLNRSDNVIDRYDEALHFLEEGRTPEVSLSSTSDFSNGREISVEGNLLVAAQDANDNNGQINQLVTYNLSDTAVAFAKSNTVDINLWGIQLSGDRLWAIADNTNQLAWYDDFSNLPEGNISVSGRVEIENLVRTHGLFYYAYEDLMLLTDVGEASSASDGAVVIVRNFSEASANGMISENEQVRIAGDATQLGNPVDIDFDYKDRMIYVAERANEGGKLISFSVETSGGDIVPEWTLDFAGASALYLNSTRTQDQYIPFNPEFDGRLMFASRLTGSQEVPPVMTDATGVAGLLLNEEMNRASINLSVNGLSGDFTGVHLHNAVTGDNGPVVVNLTDAFSANRISAEIDIDEELLTSLLSGEIYINVHTTSNPDGELRGQMLLEKDLSYVNWLSGDQEVPAVNTEASGLISCNLTQVLNELEVNVQFKNLSSHLIGAHLHNGAAGSNGPVVADLTPFVNNNTINTRVDVSSFIDDLRSGNVYINIHTENNPDGELRAQLTEWEGISFDGWVAGEQEVPQAGTPGLGLVAVNLDADLSTITVWTSYDNLTDSLAAAHLHIAAQGQNGPVWINLQDGIENGRIAYSTSDLDREGIQALLKGNVYLNMHTSEFPNGEIRGQVYGLIRDAYNYSICKEQEVMSVNNADMATGGGIASLDRNRSNLHLMAVSTMLSGDLTGVHLHNAPEGVDGNVVLDLTGFESNGGIFLYYSSDSFADNIGDELYNENIYINFHTMENPAGEIRGQIVKELTCPVLSSTEDVELSMSNLQLYPNPVGDILQIEMDEISSPQLIIIRDGSGRMVKRLNPSNGTIDMSALQPGLYLISVLSDQGLSTGKVIKQ